MPVANYVFKFAANKINLMPIRAVSFYSYALELGLHLLKVEAESSYKTTPLTINDDQGQQRTYAHQVELIIYCPYNSLNHEVTTNTTLLDVLESLRGQRVHTQLALGNTSDYDLLPGSATLLPVDNATNGAVLDFSENFSFNFEIESVEFRPRVIIRLNGVIRKLNSINIANTLNTVNFAHNYLFHF